MDNQEDAQRANEKGHQEFTPAVAFAMGEIKGSVENLRTDLREWKDDVKDNLAAERVTTAAWREDFETRLRALEKWRWVIAGAAAGGGLAGSKLIDLLVKIS